MAITPFEPSLNVEYVFENPPQADQRDLEAFAIGPLAEVLRYDVASLKSDSKLGQYDATGSLIEGSYRTSYAWPKRPNGGVLDVDYTQLFIERALLKYYQDNAENFYAVAVNKITHPSVAFIDNGAFNKNVLLGDRGAKVGDRVLIHGLDGNDEAFTLATYILGFEGELSSAAVGNAVAGGDNAPTVAAAIETTSADGGNTADHTLAADATSYSGLASGNISEVYTLECIQPSTGGDPTTARFSVTSASGLDDQFSIQPAAFDSAFAIGARGAEVTFSEGTPGADFALGDTYTVNITQVYTPPSLTVAGSYTATDQVDRTYLMEISTGDDPDGTPVLSVSEINGRDVSRSYVIEDADGTDSKVIAIGSYGITLVFTPDEGYVLGDKWTIAATAQKPESMTTIVLAHNLPANIRTGDSTGAASDLDVSLCMEVNAEIDRYGETPGVVHFEPRDLELLVKANISLKSPMWTVGDEQVALPILTHAAFGSSVNVLYSTHRHWFPADSSITSFSATKDPGSELPGPYHPDNPLKYAAVKMAVNAGGSTFRVFGTGDPTSMMGWNRALTLASERKDSYGIVPLSRRSDVLAACASHVMRMNAAAVNRYRVVWVTGEIPDQVTLVSDLVSEDNNHVLATVADNPDQTGTQYTRVEVTSDNVGLLAQGVGPGDFLRIGFTSDVFGNESYEQYEIDTVINESTLILTSGPSSSQPVARRIEVVRNLDAGAKVGIIKNNIEPYSLSADQLAILSANQYVGWLVRNMPFGTVQDGAWNVPSYHMAAAAAALRAGSLPHEPLTRKVIQGFSGVDELEEFDSDQLNEIAANGGFLVTRNQLTGRTQIRHGVTAAVVEDVNQREESVVSNIHSLGFIVVDTFEEMVGQGNVTDELIAGIRGELEAFGSYARSLNETPLLGGQLLDQEIRTVQPSTIFDDGITVILSWDLPSPSNRLNFTIFLT